MMWRSLHGTLRASAAATCCSCATRRPCARCRSAHGVRCACVTLRLPSSRWRRQSHRSAGDSCWHGLATSSVPHHCTAVAPACGAAWFRGAGAPDAVDRSISWTCP